MYDGTFNVERLDDWIERLETYFTLYGYTSKETDDLSKTLQQGVKGSFQNLKIDFKVEIPMYDESVNVERLDDWIERLETFFTLYGYTSKVTIIFATLKLSAHVLTWWKSYRKYSDGEAMS
ncbi:hypothetical protein ACLB2K_073233 [Fragaria x ananassa]